MSDEAQNHFFTQVSVSIKDLHDLTTRVDERVKHLVEKQVNIENKLNKLDENQTKLSERIAVLESKTNCVDSVAESIDDLEQVNSANDKRLTALETSHQTLQGRWQKISSFVLQLVWAVVACYVIYKLGLSDSMPP